MAESDKRYRAKKGEAYNEIVRRSYRKNKKNRLLAIRKRAENRKKIDPVFKLKEYCRNRVAEVVRGKGKSNRTFELIGCTPQFLKQYLESLFQSEMSWENYGKNGWELDHIKPCASFDLSKPEEQRKCFHYTNLQPLWREVNAKKSNKLNYDYSLNN